MCLSRPVRTELYVFAYSFHFFKTSMRSIKYCSLSEQFLTVSVPEKNNLSWFIDNAKKAVEILLTTDNASRVIESNAASQVFTGLQDLYF